MAWLVAEGDTVALNQPLAEVETAKAVVEIPSPFAGVVEAARAAGAWSRSARPWSRSRSGGATRPRRSGRATAPRGRRRDAGGREPDESPDGAGRSHRGEPASASRPRRRCGSSRRTGRRPGVGGRDRDRRADHRRGRPAAADGDPPGPRSRRAPVPARRPDAPGDRRATWSGQAAIPQVTTFRTVDATALEAWRGRARAGLAAPRPRGRALVRDLPRAPRAQRHLGEDGDSRTRAIHVGLAADTERGLVVPCSAKPRARHRRARRRDRPARRGRPRRERSRPPR